jgi:hypothetical protein
MPFHLRVLAVPLSVDISQAHQEKADAEKGDQPKRERVGQGVLPSMAYSIQPDHKEVSGENYFSSPKP